MAPARALNGRAKALAVSGTDLYVGGEFKNAAGIARADYVMALVAPGAQLPPTDAVTQNLAQPEPVREDGLPLLLIAFVALPLGLRLSRQVHRSTSG